MMSKKILSHITGLISRHSDLEMIKIKDLNRLYETSYSLGDNKYSMDFKAI